MNDINQNQPSIIENKTEIIITENNQIVNVRQATFHYLSEHPLYYFISILVVAVGVYFTYKTKIPHFVIFALIVPLIIYNSISGKMRGYLIEQFAKSLGYTYASRGDMTSVRGSLFSVGRSQVIKDVISGVDKNRPVRVFLYSYTVGGGKNSHTYNYTIFETAFGSNMPHILLHNPWLFLEGSTSTFSGTEHISLEGNFNTYFSLSVEKGFEMEAYEIFTPDFMEELIETSKTLGFEFSQNKLYIYMPKFVNTKAELDSMFALSDKLCSQLEPVINSMRDDVKDMEEEVNQGTQQKTGI